MSIQPPTLEAIHIDCSVQDLSNALKGAKPGSILNIGNPHRGRGKEEKVEILSHPEGIVIHTFRLQGGQQQHEFWLNGNSRIPIYEDPSPNISAELFEVTTGGIILQGIRLPKSFHEIRGHHRGALGFGGENNFEVCIVVLS